MKYFRWLLLIVTWDGLLPFCVAIAPIGIKIVFPNVRGAVEITAVVLPVLAFLLRAANGIRQITATCGAGILRNIKQIAFGIGLLLLTLIDCVLILSHIMPRGALFAAKEDCLMWAALFSIYFASMAFAFFPGRADSGNSDHQANPLGLLLFQSQEREAQNWDC